MFLNGCNNATLVKAIADAGIPSVIGTRQPIADDAAKHFSQGFFKALAGQKRSVAAAFAQAQTDVQTLSGQHYRSLDLSLPAAMQEWTWFMASNAPDWQLADAANPCNRLPSLPRGELPAKPFKNLYYYTAADAEIFFGRCRAILEVLQLLDEAKEPLLLLHGGTGVGKSSFLLAGLIPRLQAPSRQQPIHYRRYNELNPQQDPLAQLFGSSDPATIRTRLATPTSTGLPAIWIIDQMEEIFFAHERTQDAKTSIPPLLDTLLTTLYNVFYPEETRPKAKLILSLRKEWFAELHDACRAHQINQHDYLLKPLDKPAILEVIETPAATLHLQQHYHLRITNPPDGRLAEQIADDLLTDKQSNIAPTLQIILSRLWEQVEHQQERVWDEDLYLNEKRAGLLLEDYLDRQLQDIAAKESWGKEAQESGLLLDVLHTHTTPQGTAKTVSSAEYAVLYPHISYRAALFKALKDCYLLIEPQTGKLQAAATLTRLAHDTLAPLVKKRFDESELPGQRARRVLNNRKVEWNAAGLWKNTTPTALDSHDLKVVEKGEKGTTDWHQNPQETAIIKKSRKKRGYRRLLLFLSLIFLLLLLMFFITYFPPLQAETTLDNIIKKQALISQEYEQKCMEKDSKLLQEAITYKNSLLAVDDNFLGHDYKFYKYISLAEFGLMQVDITRRSGLKNNNILEILQQSSKDTERAIKELEYTGNEFVENADGVTGNRYYSSILKVLRAYSLMHCQSPITMPETAKKYYQELNEHDQCLAKTLEMTDEQCFLDAINNLKETPNE